MLCNDIIHKIQLKNYVVAIVVQLIMQNCYIEE